MNSKWSITIVCAGLAAMALMSGDPAKAQFGSPFSVPQVAKRSVVELLDASTDQGRQDQEAHVAVDGSGYMISVWASSPGADAILYVRSTTGVCSNNGFCENIPGQGGLHVSGMKPCATDEECRWTDTRYLGVYEGFTRAGYNPRIATDGKGIWIVVQGDQFPVNGSQALVAVRSTDNGETWLAPVNITPDPNGPPAGFAAPLDLATDGQGMWIASWMTFTDVVGNGTEGDILFSRSTDDGVNWSPPALLNTDGATDDVLNPMTHNGSTGFRDDEPQLATDGNLNWVAVWNRSGIGCCWGSKIVYAQSSDKGATWTAPAILSTDYPCNINQFPRITTDRGGTWITTWSNRCGAFGDDYDALYSRSVNNGDTWSTAELVNSWGTSDTSDPFLDLDIAPMVVADSHGNWLIAWNSSVDGDGMSGTDGEVWITRSADYGVTWTEPAYLNTNAHGDSRPDFRPSFGTDQHGNWAAFWTVQTTLDGGEDPYLARFARPDCNGNYRSDADDIALGSSADADGKGVPDECQGSLTTDCNNNLLDDLADISIGFSSDCNHDTIPDDCQLANNDCNNNKLPDDCDIALGLSLDVFINATGASGSDGIPDKCVVDTGTLLNATAAGCGNNWSCGGNWNLGGSYPNNAGANEYSVKVGSDKNIDVNFALDSLELASSAQLSIEDGKNVQFLRDGAFKSSGTVLAMGSAEMIVPGGAAEFIGASASYSGAGGLTASLSALDVVASNGAIVTLKGAMLATSSRDTRVESGAAFYVADQAVLEVQTGVLSVGAGSLLAKDPGSTNPLQALMAVRNMDIAAANDTEGAGVMRLIEQAELFVGNSLLIAGDFQFSGESSVSMPAQQGIEGVRMLSGGIVRKTEGDEAHSNATMSVPTMMIDGEQSTPTELPAAQLRVEDSMAVMVTAGDLVNFGEILVADQSLIEVKEGTFFLHENGVYKADLIAAAGQGSVASINFGKIVIGSPGSCCTIIPRPLFCNCGMSLNGPPFAPTMELSGQMAVESYGDFSSWNGTVLMADNASITVYTGEYLMREGAKQRSIPSAAPASAPTVTAPSFVLKGETTTPYLLPAANMQLNRNTLVTAASGAFFLDGGKLQMAEQARVNVSLGNFHAAAGSVTEMMDFAADDNAAAFAPNSSSIGALYVTINGAQTTPELHPAASVEVRNAASLTATQDLSLLGNLSVGEQAAVLCNEFRAAEDGKYAMAAGADVATSASLDAVNGFIEENAELNLSGAMQARFTGALAITGDEAFAVAGISPPPKLRLNNDATVALGGSLTVTGVAETFVASTAEVSVAGDYANQCVSPSKHDWPGKLRLDGSAQQFIEVAGIDLGANMEGFDTDADALFDSSHHENFSIGRLEVAANSIVAFENNFANTAATGPCQEAMYVNELALEAGAQVTLDNVVVYYQSLEDNGATITKIGCGDLLPVALPNVVVWAPTLNPIPWPNINPHATTRSLRFTVTGPAGPSKPEAIKVTMVDMQHPRPANLPAQAPPNLTTYDTRMNAVCVGGTHPGHHCDTAADCPGAGSSCPSRVGCTADPACSNPLRCTLPSNGCARWVGKLGTFYEAQGPPVAGPYKAARLQCTPYYWDWKPEGLLTVVGADIAPSSEYSVQVYGASCMGAEDGCAAVSPAVTMFTRRSGDVEQPFTPPGVSTQPDVTDIAQLVNKFKNLSGALVKAISQLQPNLPELNADINALDIVAVVDSVKGLKWAFSGPCACPSLVTCGATACTSPTPCVTAYGAGSTCVKTCTGPGPLMGDPCINNTHCVGSGTCGAGFCRDRCGRCSP